MNKKLLYLFVILALLVSAFPAAISTALADDSFRFTVTSDSQGEHTRLGILLQSIADGAGPGAFHVTAGDATLVQDSRDVIDDKFGPDTIWYAIVGNHEVVDSPDEMVWLRDEYNNGNSTTSNRTALKYFTNQDGPAGSTETTYSWDYGNAHFVALNCYWNGGTAPGSDTAASGDIVKELYDWLALDLAANTQPFVFVFVHEPAYPQNRHIGDSLDQYPDHRDALCNLLDIYDVQVLFNGHTHFYSKAQNDGVWYLDSGNSGKDSRSEADGMTYFDVTVGSSQATINVYRDNETEVFSLHESITVDAHTSCGSQIWQLDSESAAAGYEMEKTGGPGDDGQTGSASISSSASLIWMADQAATADITLPGGTWAVELATESDWGAEGDNCTMEIGEWDGAVFTPFTASELSSVSWELDGTHYIIKKELDVGAETVQTGNYLAVRITNNDGVGHTAYTAEGAEASYVISPCSDPGYPVPELTTGILVAIGLGGLGMYVSARRRQDKLSRQCVEVN